MNKLPDFFTKYATPAELAACETATDAEFLVIKQTVNARINEIQDENKRIRLAAESAKIAANLSRNASRYQAGQDEIELAYQRDRDENSPY